MLEQLLNKKLHDLPFDEYLSFDAASSHGLKNMRRSPKYYAYMRENPVKSKSMGLGTLVHAAVLEPERFKERLKTLPEVDRRTKEGKSIYEAFKANLKPGDFEVNNSDAEKLEQILKSLNSNAFSKSIISKQSEKEKSAFWIHEATGELCKIRPDIAFLDQHIIVDLKTCAEAGPLEFSRAIYKNGYDIQAAFYIDGYRAIYGRRPQFIWLCVETTPPYDVAAYYATERVYGFGKVRYEKAIFEYAQCKASGDWPGFPQVAVPIDLPSFAESAESNLEDMQSFTQGSEL